MNLPSGESELLSVAFINRRPMDGHFSLESYFHRIHLSLLSLGVDVVSCTSPYYSKGLISRCKTIYYARHNQRCINHITGDIHFAAFGLNSKRTVVTVHDCGRLHQLSGFRREILRQFWFEIPLKRVAAVTVVSQAVKDDLLNWVPNLSPDRIHVVPVSIAPEFIFSPKPFNSQNPRILQIGTKLNKNLHRLIRAMVGLPVTLVILGKIDPELANLLSSCNIQYENYYNLSQRDVVRCYRDADLLAFASILEGFGMPILEAQATGRPVLTSNCTSMPEVAGDGALFVDPFSVDSIRSGLIQLIEDESLRYQLVNRGLRNCRRFSSDAIAASYFRIYQSLLMKVSSHE